MEDPFLFHHETACELFIIRHADAIPDADEIIPSGIYDDLPLSKTGRGQAQALAERLGSTNFNAAYSSPLRRCLETAAPLLEKNGLQPTIIPNLQEVRLGEVRELPKDGKDLVALTKALQARQIDIVRIAGGTGNWDTIPGSEPSKAFRKRVVEAIDSIAQQHLGERALVFCHGGVVNAYVAEVLGLAQEFFYPAANTSITIVRATATHRVLYVMNDVAHLKRV